MEIRRKYLKSKMFFSWKRRLRCTVQIRLFRQRKSFRLERWAYRNGKKIISEVIVNRLIELVTRWINWEILLNLAIVCVCVRGREREALKKIHLKSFSSPAADRHSTQSQSIERISQGLNGHSQSNNKQINTGNAQQNPPHFRNSSVAFTDRSQAES